MSSEFFKKSHNSEDFNQNTGELVRWLWNSSRIKFWSEYWWNFWRISIRSLEILWKIWRISIRILLKDLKDFDQNSGGELVTWLWNSNSKNSNKILLHFDLRFLVFTCHLFWKFVLKLRFGTDERTDQLSDKNEKWWIDVDIEARVWVLGLKKHRKLLLLSW